MKPLHFRLISLIFLLIGANIEALQSEQNDRNNFVINDDIAGETEEDYEDQLKQEASNETFSVLDTFKEDAPQEEVLEDLLPPVVVQDSNYTFSESEIEPENSTNDDDLPEILLGPRNVTAYLGDRVELRCQVSGKPKPKVQWFSKRDQQLPNIGANFRIHRNNSLIFRRVDKRDESYYQCTAINRHGNISSPMARLTVEAKVNIVEAPDIIRAPFGTSHELQCVATGDPPPLISWLKDGRTILEGHEYKPFAYYSRSVLRINVTDNANYTCYAINQMIGGRQSVDQESFMVYVQGEENTVVKDVSKAKGYCAPYNGQVCRKYLQGRGLVWFNISQDNSGGWLNEQIAQNLHDELIRKMAEPCKSAAEALLCKYAFPDCTLREGGIAVGLPLCHEDCMALRNHYCFKDWALIDDNKRRNVFVKSRGHFRLPKCEDLPKHSNSTKTCTKSSITTMRWDLATTNCVKSNGRFYQGHQNTTATGLTCQTWFSRDPHVQTMPQGIFPEMNLAKNYCRNPGGTEPSPWCYTTDPMIRWQHCKIEPCDNITDIVDYASDVEILGKTDFMQEIFSPSFIVLASCVAVATLIVILLIGLICNKMCSRKNPNGYTIPTNQETSIDLDKLPENMSYHQTQALLNPKLEHLEFPRNDIIYLRDVGQGAFGRVFQAKVPGLVKGEEFTMVAVKMLKEEATDNLIRDFEREASLLAEFEHPNIVKLLGVCAIGKPMCLLFEFMSKGDLNAYLRSCSPSNYIVRCNGGSTTSSTFSDVKISHIEQVTISKQITTGMIYLSDRKFVHRDLASRNCLLDHHGQVKIADFGLSQKVYLQEYYRGDEQDAIPIRWMPLEAILHNKYTIESDIWAFGVLLWEIFSLALQPYYGLSHEEVIKGLKEGQVLQCPENTPKSVYKLMILCWNPKPNARPSFRTLYREMETIERELKMIQKHFRSQKSIISETGRNTPQSPKSFV